MNLNKIITIFTVGFIQVYLGATTMYFRDELDMKAPNDSESIKFRSNDNLFKVSFDKLIGLGN